MNYIELTGPLIWPLGILSILASVLIIERAIFFARLKKNAQCPFLQEAKETLKKNKKLSKHLRDDIATHQLLDIKEHFYFGIRLLRLIAVISPMVGLLGTVLGIVSAFQNIAHHTGPVVPSLIAEGLWTAMLTTAIGLIIALPCLFFTFIFARIAEKRIGLYQQTLNAESLRMEGASID